MKEQGEDDVQRCFHRCLERNEQERADLLTQIRAKNPDLFHEVSSLLEVYEDANQLMDQPLFGQVLPVYPEVFGPNKTPSIAHYRVMQLLGEGATAKVYFAEQEQPVKRKVALKVLHGEMNTREFLARFAFERQALALMNHSAIARIYEIGTTGEGRPFFTMEYVPGTPITVYCDQKSLSLTARLQLFLDVCDGVHHAHQNLIIHRDLKPSNILVTDQEGSPIPKIIDFGIAKALEPLQGQVVDPTFFGTFLGTPPYMSPEQTQKVGLALDTRTDVYSLGVLLHMLVTGVSPFQRFLGEDNSIIEVMRIIRDEAPTRPSKTFRLPGLEPETLAQNRGTSVQALSKTLAEDLDWIVVKAMEKQRSRRYDSVVALAADIRRYLNNEPLEASPPARAYILKKFLQRNRKPALLAAAGVLALALGFVIATAGWLKASHSEKQTRVYSDYLTNLLATPDPRVIGQDVTLLRYLESVIQNEQGDPEIEALISTTFGRTYVGLGQYERAVAQLKKAHDIRLKLFGEAHPETLFTAFHLGLAYMQQEKLDQAEQLLRATVLHLDRVLGPDHPQTLRAHRALADTLMATGHLEGLEASYRDTLTRQTRVVGETHRDTLLTGTNLAHLLHRNGKLKEADAFYASTLQVRKEVLGPDHPYTLNSMNSRANNFFFMGKLPEARELAKTAFAGYSRVLGLEHPYTLSCFTNLANIYRGGGELEEAERLYRQALEIRTRVSGKAHSETLLLMNNLADLLLARKSYEQAKQIKLAEVNICRNTFGQHDPITLFASLTLGEILFSSGEPAEAEQLYRQISQSYQRHPRLEMDKALTMGLLGYALFKQGRLVEAEKNLVASYSALRAGNSVYQGNIHEYLEQLCDHFAEHRLVEEESRVRTILNALVP